ncbi:MAG: hypothetical protein OES64_10220 [Desulfobacteraceae bacterium]|nr:hypothetical protein [Desulfobacteraceae bacterium]
MEMFLMTFTSGVMVGGIYALVALGWVLIYKCSGVLNLAMGEMTLIGAYVSLSFYSMGIPFLLALLFSLIIGLVLGILTERIFLDKLIGEPVLTVIMVTVGPHFSLKERWNSYGVPIPAYLPRRFFQLSLFTSGPSLLVRRISGALWPPSFF